MAFNRAPSPVLRLDGVLRQLDTYQTGEKSAHGPGHDAGRASVLTNDGGFLEVYVDPQYLPNIRQLGSGSDVSWLIEVDVFTQTSARGTKWSTLSARIVKDLDHQASDADAARNVKNGLASTTAG